MTITVRGARDDSILINGDLVEEFNLNPKNPSAVLGFSNGVALRVGLTASGVWRITPVTALPADGTVAVSRAPEGDEGNYTDVAVFTEDITWVVCGTSIAFC